jgi:hypothetical protein
MRIKQEQIENTEKANKIKNKADEAKKSIISQSGMRLRDFSSLFQNKRPKIFCVFLNILVGEKSDDYE